MKTAKMDIALFEFWKRLCFQVVISAQQNHDLRPAFVERTNNPWALVQGNPFGALDGVFDLKN